ncbi:calcium-activated chloride channel regulator 1-like [Uloborus diversus]|uniref:calcium-activated chloride channel regulator 1-like n=1 Tax=Uloborus diversus TaxID=327109 RepID=UPI00240A8E19|nr:calcium-activated chloride channel regulator 1-like [Uloborus diversus]
MDLSVPRLNLLRLLLLLCFSANLNLASVITIEDNGYKGIVVAIHNHVPEDLELLENLKTLFSRASTFLYNSTQNGLYFKEVKIVVPPTWSQRPEYEILPGNFFSTAHIRVDTPNPEYKDTPYTVQPGGCGEPGQYIHLTPWFLKELNGETVDMFGAPERQLVHEWAHLKYGVFDEYGIPGDKRYPMFYNENGKIRPTSCVRDIKGWIESRDGGPCKMTLDGEVEKDCIFIPNMHSNEAKASIMYMPFIPSMEGFCDDSSHKHNIYAPTKHNAICNYRSTWDVISSHSDFQQRVKRDTASQELTETLFRIIQSPTNPTSRYVLVLDVSGSMNGQPMKLLHSAATRLVEDRIPDGAYLGIVQFSTEASILQNLTKVDSVTRAELSKSLPSLDDGGRTAIGKGLQEAIKVLTYANGTAEGGLIMLITDGEENVLPFIEDILPKVLQHNVIVNAVAFGSEASHKLENMTTVTGGRGYFFSNNGSRPASALDSAFLESITSQADVELQPVQLKDEMFTLDEEITSKFVYIDKELGKETIFTVTSPHISRIGDIVLRSPTGTLYDSTSPYYNRDDVSRQRIKVALPEAESGRWEIIIRRRDDYPIMAGFAVTSEPKDIRDQPIRVRSWLNEIQLKFPAHAKVYAEVKKGYLAVIGATVIATVERPVGPTIDVVLRDDGIGADVTENDGIYTGYFTHFNGNGRYAVIARITNDGQARLKQTVASASQPIPVQKSSTSEKPTVQFSPEDFEMVDGNNTETETEEALESASQFDRSSNTGAFRLEAWSPDAGDVIPPGDILDLFVLSIKEENDEEYDVTFQFTMPGDDLDEGIATSLTMRASKNQEDLLSDFENGYYINETLITNGSLIPTAAGEKTILTIQIPEDLKNHEKEAWTIYFAVRAKDETGKVSSKFNVVSVTFGMREQIIRSLSSKKEDEEVVEEPEEPEIEISTFEHTSEETTQNKIEDDSEMFDHVEDNDETGKTPKEMSEKMSKREESENNGNNSFKWWPVAVGIGVAISVIMVVVLIAVLVLKKARMKTYSSVQREQC